MSKIYDINQLSEKRKKVKSLTFQILKLVKERTKLAKEIGDIKKGLDFPIEDIKVETDLKKDVIEECKNLGIDVSLGLKILSLLIQESIKVEKEEREVSLPQLIKEAKEIEKKGEKVIHLEIGELDFNPLNEALKGIEEGLRLNLYKYSDEKGELELRQRLAEHFNDLYLLDLKEDNVIITPGGRFALYLVFKALLNLGEEVIGFGPFYPPYKKISELEGARFLAIETDLESKWSPNLELLNKCLSKITKLIILNYPNNPTGKILEPSELKSIVDLAREREVYVVNDEVYSDFVFEKNFKSLLSFDYKNSIIVSSFSKSFAMSGFRIGYIISKRKEIIDRLSKLQGLLITCMPPFIQYSALRVLEAKKEVGKFVEEIKGRAKETCKRLKELPLSFYEPDGGLYIFPRIEKEYDSDLFVRNMLYKHKVALASGKNFGNYPKYFRLSLCEPREKIIEGIERMREELE
ncbi:MAG: aminotransferase class I/II-fold pyridoxal phosphate-dependent enzyme [Nitrososphaerales archaeon]